MADQAEEQPSSIAARGQACDDAVEPDQMNMQFDAVIIRYVQVHATCRLGVGESQGVDVAPIDDGIRSVGRRRT